MFEATIWAFLPALVAIVLALVTKQVYPSLFAGILVGALFFAEGNVLNAFSDIIMLIGEKLGQKTDILLTEFVIQDLSGSCHINYPFHLVYPMIPLFD